MSIKLVNVIKNDLKKVLIKNLLSGLKMKGKSQLKTLMGEFFLMSLNMYLKMEGLRDGQEIIIKMFLSKEGVEYGELNLVVK